MLQRSYLARKILLFGFVLVAAIAISHAFYYFVRVVDDAFITLRYAERLVDGLGLTYNDYERVEGFSNPTWLGLQSLLILLGINGVAATKFLSVFTYIGIFWAGNRFGKEVLALSGWARLLMSFLVATSAYIASWAMWGLETPLYIALMLVCMTELQMAVRLPSRKRTVTLALSLVAFVMTRPEAALYVVAWTIGVLLIDARGKEWRVRLKTLLPAAALSALILAGLVGARVVYFGQILPQTYYAKQGAGFDLGKLGSLWGQGASLIEVALSLIGVFACGALLLFSIRGAKMTGEAGSPQGHEGPVHQRIDESSSSILLMTLLANTIFVCGVRTDWMPNVRHLLPFWMCVFFGACWTADSLWRRGGKARLVSYLIVAVALACGVYGYFVDSRYSPSDFATHGRGQQWVKWKSAEGWETASAAFVRTPPDHVALMHVNSLGMIDQLFRVLESSAAPERESWFIGRDIGMVGYYSDVQVFDTDGLFTPVLSRSEEWIRSGTVTNSVLDAAFAKVPVATDLLDDWPRALGARKDVLREYEVLVGSASWPVSVRPKAAKRPSPQEVLNRYERVREKFNQAFFIGTLYGENVGAAVEKRYHWIRNIIELVEPVVVPDSEIPPDLVGRAVLDGGALEALGCRIAPTDVELRYALTCYWKRRGRPSSDWTVFVHIVPEHEPRRLLRNADHPPVGGWLPINEWPLDTAVRDAVVVDLSDVSAVQGVRYGLFKADRRCPGEGDMDAEGRIVGPVFNR